LKASQSKVTVMTAASIKCLFCEMIKMPQSEHAASNVGEAEINRLNAETLRIEAETSQLLRPWYLHPGVAGAWLTAIASLVALTAAWLGGYFDNRHEELAEQRGALLQDINNLKTDLKMLQGRELQYKQLILASESVLHGKEQQLVTEKSV